MKNSQKSLERARLRFEKVAELYRAAPSDALFSEVREAHAALVAAQKKMLVEQWSGSTCPRCHSPIERTIESTRPHYRCEKCDYMLKLV